jgi:sulfate transporter 4
LACIGFLDVHKAQRLWRVKRADFTIYVGTFVATIMFGLELGVVMAALLSLGVVIFRVSEPHLPIVGRVPGGEEFVEIDRRPDAVVRHDVVTVRIDAPLFYANTERVQQRLLALAPRLGEVSVVVVDCSAVTDIDSTAADGLKAVAQELERRDVRLCFAAVGAEVRDVLDRVGVTELVGADRYFVSAADADDAV